MKKIKDYVQYGKWMVPFKIITKAKDMRIVQYYMPTSNSNVRQMEEVFYKLIEKVIEIIKGEKNLIIMSD